MRAADPVLDFIGAVLNDSETLTNWAGEESHQPNGGYLYKFEYDVDNNGKLDLFLASSISHCDNKSCSWTLYLQNQTGAYTKAGDGILIAPEAGFLLARSSSGRPQIITTFIAGADVGITDTQELSSQGNLVLSRQQLNQNQIANDGGHLGTRVTPSIKKVLLAEYLKVQSPQWRTYDKKYSSTSQQSDAADANALSYANDFMFEDAQSLLQTRQNP
jgi:hypothetical protein